MKIIIAGSRDLTDYRYVEVTMKHFFLKYPDINRNDIEIVSGGAKGIDSLGEEYARKYNLDLVVFHANWKKYGKSAGYKRNMRMGLYADMLVAIRLNKSNGTTHMINIMQELGKEKYVVDVAKNV